MIEYEMAGEDDEDDEEFEKIFNKVFPKVVKKLKPLFKIMKENQTASAEDVLEELEK